VAGVRGKEGKSHRSVPPAGYLKVNMPVTSVNPSGLFSVPAVSGVIWNTLMLPGVTVEASSG